MHFGIFDASTENKIEFSSPTVYGQARIHAVFVKLTMQVLGKKKDP
jgi:hypothetical protein